MNKFKVVVLDTTESSTAPMLKLTKTSGQAAPNLSSCLGVICKEACEEIPLSTHQRYVGALESLRLGMGKRKRSTGIPQGGASSSQPVLSTNFLM